MVEWWWCLVYYSDAWTVFLQTSYENQPIGLHDVLAFTVSPLSHHHLEVTVDLSVWTAGIQCGRTVSSRHRNRTCNKSTWRWRGLSPCPSPSALQDQVAIIAVLQHWSVYRSSAYSGGPRSRRTVSLPAVLWAGRQRHRYASKADVIRDSCCRLLLRILLQDLQPHARSSSNKVAQQKCLVRMTKLINIARLKTYKCTLMYTALSPELKRYLTKETETKSIWWKRLSEEVC